MYTCTYADNQEISNYVLHSTSDSELHGFIAAGIEFQRDAAPYEQL